MSINIGEYNEPIGEIFSTSKGMWNIRLMFHKDTVRLFSVFERLAKRAPNRFKYSIFQLCKGRILSEYKGKSILQVSRGLKKRCIFLKAERS